jgi:hypothetical protein
MSYIHNWQFNPLESYPSAEGQVDVVFKVHWQCYASTGSLETNDYYSDFETGVIPVTYESGSTFIPFNELTREIVYSWVENAMGIDEVNSIQQSLENRIESKIHPTVLIQTSPWL